VVCRFPNESLKRSDALTINHVIITHNGAFSLKGDATFINQLVDFDKDNMSDKVLKKIGTYVNSPDFKPDLVGRVSGAAKSLCMWVRAMEVYGRIFRVVEPKRKVCTLLTIQYSPYIIVLLF